MNIVSLPRLNKQAGVLAQMVEQWTENPCVPGSIPGDTTKQKDSIANAIGSFALEAFFPSSSHIGFGVLSRSNLASTFVRSKR